MKGIYYILILFLFACKNPETKVIIDLDNERTYSIPNKILINKELQLYKLPENYYKTNVFLYGFNGSKLNNSFKNKQKVELSNGVSLDFKPLNFETTATLEYTQTYADFEKINPLDTVNHIINRYNLVQFPNPFYGKRFVEANTLVQNKTNENKTIYLRLFYQNTSYWYPTDKSIDLESNKFLDNFYGCSEIIEVNLKPNEEKQIFIPYQIKTNAKNDQVLHTFGEPRVGNYEFVLLSTNQLDDFLMNKNLNLSQTNPIAEIQKAHLLNWKDSPYYNNFCYVGSHHFKFVLLDEKFDGTNDLKHQRLFEYKHNVQKPLDSEGDEPWDGKFRNVISEKWLPKDFFEGYIEKAPKVTAEYGNRKENVEIVNQDCILKIPASTPQNLQKTWGEIFLGPRLKYGRVIVRAKFAQMINKETKTPNGIIHNLWLYQTGKPNYPHENHPYKDFSNFEGKRKFEIDMEFWTTIQEGSQWDDNIQINYSVVDYMENEHALLKPGKDTIYSGYHYDRLNNVQLNIPSENIHNSFLDDFHIYEIEWTPQYVKFFVDSKEVGYIDNIIGCVPNQYLSLWIGSPIYQDGTYYDQRKIPFLEKDKFTIIDWIRIE